MNFELVDSLGWREGLIAVIVLLLSYIIVMFLRMRRLQKDLSIAAVPQAVAQSALAAYTGIQGPEAAGAPSAAAAEDQPPTVEPAPPATAAGEAQAPSVLEAAELDFAWNEPPPEIPGQAVIDALQAELYQLRCEVDELRTDLSTAREDFRRQLAQLSESEQTASPLYNDAMQMAAQGQDAATIAQHCGIARAEADLVVALVRNRNDGS